MGACAFSKQGKKVIVIQTDNSLLDRLTPTQIKMLKLKFQQFESKGGLNLDGFKKLMPYITKLPQISSKMLTSSLVVQPKPE